MSHCNTPPIGWSCSREPGHTGPCAATRVPLTIAQKAKRILWVLRAFLYAQRILWDWTLPRVWDICQAVYDNLPADEVAIETPQYHMQEEFSCWTE